MIEPRHMLLLALLFTGNFQALGWIDAVPIKGPVFVGEPVLRKQILIPNNTTTIPALKLNRRSKTEHIALKDGSIYFGELAGFDAQKGFLWKHPHITPDLRVSPEHAQYIQLCQRETPANSRNHNCQITLANEDALSGELKSLSDGKLILSTWYGGELQLKQTALKTLVPGFTALKDLYQGPKSVRDWTFYDSSSGQYLKALAADATAEEVEKKSKKLNLSNGAWKLKDQTFEAQRSQARVGRNFENLPNSLRYDFNVHWTGYLNLYVNFLTDNFNSYSSGNAYCLRINTSYAYLYRYKVKNGAGNGRLVGSHVRINLNTLGNHARFSIRVDRKKNSIALFVNEKFVEHWDDAQNDPLPNESKGLMFTTMSSNPVTLSQIGLSEWNGKIPGGNNVTEQQGDQDFILFANEDSMSGKLIGIAEGNMTFETPFAKLPIPLKNITRVNLAKSKPEPLSPRTVRAVMRNGQGSVSGELLKWEDGKISLKSPYFGEASFVESIFQSIEFGAKPLETSRLQPPTTELKPLPVRQQLRKNILPQIELQQLER